MEKDLSVKLTFAIDYCKLLYHQYFADSKSNSHYLRAGLCFSKLGVHDKALHRL
jgi:hypothetical protein